MKKVSAIVIGAGQRGTGYAHYALDFPDRLQIVGVAEPRKFYRDQIIHRHNVTADKAFESWEDIAAKDKFADCAFVTTQDQLHKAPTVALAKKGYHIFLEKPMAVTYEDCREIVETCKQNNVMLAVGHVLRYTPQARAIKRIIESGVIGEVVNIQHLEPVGFWHFAHSFVRGNWGKLSESSFSLMTKCCHDLDLIGYWMGSQKCVAISSMGSLKHFSPSNKPAEASDRCLDCKLQNTCPYSATKIYLDSVKMGYKGFPVKCITPVPDIESVTEVLRTTPYGKCVYNSDNDVMDNQVVTMQFEGGATCSMSMVAFTEKLCERQTRIAGTKGELTCDFGTSLVRQFDFSTETPFNHDVLHEIRAAQGSSLQGHGGADFFAMQAFVEAVAMNSPEKILTGPEESLYSHYLCFVAEKARIDKVVLDLTKDIVLD